MNRHHKTRKWMQLADAFGVSILMIAFFSWAIFRYPTDTFGWVLAACAFIGLAALPLGAVMDLRETDRTPTRWDAFTDTELAVMAEGLEDPLGVGAEIYKAALSRGLINEAPDDLVDTAKGTD